MDNLQQKNLSVQNESSKLARNLYCKTSKLEKELQLLLKRKSPNDKSITQTRLEIRENYEKILFLDLKFATSKDIDQLLWKCVYYKPIDEFRKIIKKYHQQCSSDGQNGQAKEKLHKTCSFFLNFLSEAVEYYKYLYDKLDDKSKELKREGNEEMENLVRNSLHKSLINMGDLCRYAQLYNEKQSKDWSIAAKYYRDALELMPNSGNSHNQLAVLATYQNNDFEAIYRYIRSLSVKKPFISARENMILLFEKNRQKYVRSNIAHQSTVPHPSRKPKKKIYKEVNKSNEDLLEKIYLEFVRLHGILFTKINVETMEGIMSSTLTDVEEILKNTDLLMEEVILKMTIMNIFAIDNIKNSKKDNATILRYSVDLACSIFCILITHTQKLHYRYLSSIHTFIRYLIQEKELIQQVKDSGMNIWSKTSEFLYQTLNYGVKSKSTDKFTEKSTDKSTPLQEDVELLGFLPLQSPAITLDQRSMPSSNSSILSIRMQRIQQIADDFKRDTTIQQYCSLEKDIVDTNSNVNGKSTQSSPKMKINEVSQPKKKENGGENQFINAKYVEFREEEEEEEYQSEEEQLFENDHAAEDAFTGGLLSNLINNEDSEDSEEVEGEEFVFNPKDSPVFAYKSNGQAQMAAIDRPFESSNTNVPYSNFHNSEKGLNHTKRTAGNSLDQYSKPSELLQQQNPSFFSNTFFSDHMNHEKSDIIPTFLGNHSWKNSPPNPSGKVIERPFYAPTAQQQRFSSSPSSVDGQVISQPFSWGSSPFLGGQQPQQNSIPNGNPIYHPNANKPTMEFLMDSRNDNNGHKNNSSSHYHSVSSNSFGSQNQYTAFPFPGIETNSRNHSSGTTPTMNNASIGSSGTRLKNPFT